MTADLIIPTASGKYQGVIDITMNVATVWVITRGDRQPDSETITFPDGKVWKRTFTYTNDVMTARSQWVKQ